MLSSHYVNYEVIIINDGSSDDSLKKLIEAYDLVRVDLYVHQKIKTKPFFNTNVFWGLLILPFIAVPFGLNYGRNPSSAGIAIGVVFLISLQKTLEFGQSLGAAGKIPPWTGIWPTIAIVALFAFWLFRKSAFKMGQPPLTAVSHYITYTKEKVRDKVDAIFSAKENLNS